MKELKGLAPKEITMMIDGVEVTYGRIDKNDFIVGDLVTLDGEVFHIYEGVSHSGNIKTRSTFVIGCQEVVLIEQLYISHHYLEFGKANESDTIAFNRACLENGFWFDQVNKKWIELKDGGVYNVDGLIEIFDEYTPFNNSLNFKCTLKESGNIFELGYVTGFHNIKNISEATEEQKQQLFDALAKEGKQWNAEKRCVEDMKWKPKKDELYWFVNSTYFIASERNGTGSINEDRCRKRLEVGNCFKTREECEKYAEYMKKCSLGYKPE